MRARLIDGLKGAELVKRKVTSQVQQIVKMGGRGKKLTIIYVQYFSKA